MSSYVLHASVRKGVNVIPDDIDQWNCTFVRAQHGCGFRIFLDILDVVDEDRDFREEGIIVRESVGFLYVVSWATDM